MLENNRNEHLQSRFSDIFALKNSDLQTIKKAFSGCYSVFDERLAGDAWQCLDTFDHELSAAKQILLRHGSTLVLYQADKGILVQENCPKAWFFVAELDDGYVQRCLGHVSELRACLPVTEVAATLHRCRILDDESKTVCRLQWLQFGLEEGEYLSLVQLQGVRGYVKALKTIRSVPSSYLADAEAAGKPTDGRLSAAPDGGQILHVLCPERKIYTGKPVVKIDPQASAAQIKTDLIGVYLNNARLNEAGVIADWDTEFLHEYRVSLRKVRSVLSLFKGVFDEAETSTLKQKLADTMKVTNRLRDLDVYLLDKADYLTLVPESLRSGLDKMFADFAQERKRQLSLVKKQLSSAAYRGTMQLLQQQFPASPAGDKPPRIKTPLGSQADAPVGDYASALIYKRYRKIRKLARTIDDNTPDEEVHELRIHFKKLRYLMEFFAPLYPAAELKKLLKAMKRLQTCLGRFNDFSVQQLSLKETVESPPSGKRKPDTEVVLSIGALVAAIHQKQVTARHEIVLNLDVFTSDATCATFERLFHNPPLNLNTRNQGAAS